MKFVNGLEIDASYLLLLEETREVGGIMLGSCLTVVRQGKGVKKRGYAVRRGLRESGHPEKPPLGEV